VATLLRWLAPRLLGPSTAERLALAEERELQLAERNRVAHELHSSTSADVRIDVKQRNSPT